MCKHGWDKAKSYAPISLTWWWPYMHKYFKELIATIAIAKLASLNGQSHTSKRFNR